MKKYLLRILLFIVVLILMLSINKLRYYYYYGIPEYEIKIEDFKEKNSINSINTVFFGSSHIYRQLNPKVFDEINLYNNVKTNSYNLGIQGCFSIEQLYLLEQFLKSPLSKSIKNIFIELQLPYKIDDANVLSKRGHYFVKLKSLYQLLKIRYDSNYKLVLSYFKAFFLNLINYQSSLYPNVKNNSYELKESFKNNGFYPLNEQYSKYKQPNFLKVRRQKFLDNADNIIDKSKNKSFKKIDTVIERYLFLIEEIKNKYEGIEFFVTCHPFNCALVEKEIGSINILCLNGKPWLNLIEDRNNYFDAGHLSEKGAEKYTINTAEMYLNIISHNTVKVEIPGKFIQNNTVKKTPIKYYPTLKKALNLPNDKLELIIELNRAHAKKSFKNDEALKKAAWGKQQELKRILGDSLYKKKVDFDRSIQ